MDGLITAKEKESQAVFSLKACQVGDKKFEDRIYITVHHSKNTIASVLAKPEHFEKYPAQWAIFQASEEYKFFRDDARDDETRTYTPLTEVHGIGPSRLEELKSLGIKSAQDLAEASPDDLGGIRGAPLLIERAAAAIQPESAAA